MSDEIKQAIDEWHDMTPDAPKPTLDERRFKIKAVEFYANYMAMSDSLDECKSHTPKAEHEDIRCYVTKDAHDACRAEMQTEIERLEIQRRDIQITCGELGEDNRKLREALESISKNSCCEQCQEAKLVASKALEAK